MEPEQGMGGLRDMELEHEMVALEEIGPGQEVLAMDPDRWASLMGWYKKILLGRVMGSHMKILLDHWVNRGWPAGMSQARLQGHRKGSWTPEPFFSVD